MKSSSRFSRRFQLRALMLACLFLFFKGEAINLSFGFGAGWRKLNDRYLREVYGDGYVFIPQAQLQLSRFVSIEIAYEGGYEKRAAIGIYQEPSTLKIAGWEFSGLCHYSFRGFRPFAKFGLGYYGYRQDIDSPHVPWRVNHHHFSFQAGTGVCFLFGSKFYFQPEIKFVWLKVKPFNQQVDLGGWRYIISLGYRL